MKYLYMLILVLFIFGCGSKAGLVATRELPSSAQAGSAFTVTINVDLDEGGSEAVAVEETLPIGCSLSGSSINSMDETTPTWIFDNADLPLPTNPRADTTFTYNIVCDNAGTLTFSGQISMESAGSRSIGGDKTISIS